MNDWREAAPCSADPDLFFAEGKQGAGGGVSVDQHRAIMLCLHRCPVLEQCRADCDGFESHQAYLYWAGVWAAETPAMRRERRACD